jgi:hypothetical protein
MFFTQRTHDDCPNSLKEVSSFSLMGMTMIRASTNPRKVKYEIYLGDRNNKKGCIFTMISTVKSYSQTGTFSKIT